MSDTSVKAFHATGASLRDCSCFFVFLVRGLFGLSVGQSPSLSPPLSLSLSPSPSPFHMHCAQDEAKLMLNGPAPDMEWGGEFLSVLKEKFSRSSPLVQVFVFRRKSPEFTHQYVFFC